MGEADSRGEHIPQPHDRGGSGKYNARLTERPTCRLGVLDLSPIRQGGTAARALEETLSLAVAAEQFGYDRYWLAEHHNARHVAGTCPEILVALIASKTARIRVGSGGVMLRHYSALKVAETFRLLEALYPGRIELGVGRGRGGNRLAAAALAHPASPNESARFPDQLADLIGYLQGDLAVEHPFAGVRACPDDGSGPPVWLLGSHAESAALAGRLGLPFGYAHFLDDGGDGPAITAAYRRAFRPSARLARARSVVAVHVMCAETEQEARRLAISRNVSKLMDHTGQRRPLLPVQQAQAYVYGLEELGIVGRFMRSCIDGNPEQVRTRLEAMAAQHDTSDLLLITTCYDFAARVRSYNSWHRLSGRRTDARWRRRHPPPQISRDESASPHRAAFRGGQRPVGRIRCCRRQGRHCLAEQVCRDPGGGLADMARKHLLIPVPTCVAGQTVLQWPHAATV